MILEVWGVKCDFEKEGLTCSVVDWKKIILHKPKVQNKLGRN